MRDTPARKRRDGGADVDRRRHASAVEFRAAQVLPHELRDYALLADGQRGILADPDGELAWMCFPTWSDPAVLASLLGSGGSYRIRPNGRYVPGGCL